MLVERVKRAEEAHEAITRFDRKSAAEARAYLALFEAFGATPLVYLDGLASRLGLGSIAIKDESWRFRLQSFKALGGSYAVLRLAKQLAEQRIGRSLTPEELLIEDVGASLVDFVVACATDGNHGRSVASAACLLGIPARIYMHSGVSEARVKSVEELGATVVRTPGNYDDSVALAASQSAANGWILVSDTAWNADASVPLTVMEGYTVLTDEAVAQLRESNHSITHVFLQAGVGGFAASVSAYLHNEFGDDRPVVVVVEPATAACVTTSLVKGEATEVAADTATIMGMLECFAPSPVAVDILRTSSDFAICVDDCDAIRAMKVYAAGSDGDPGVVSGESGAASLAGLLRVVEDSAARNTIGLDGSSRVLLINTEGATDEASYCRIVGRSSAEVRAS